MICILILLFIILIIITVLHKDYDKYDCDSRNITKYKCECLTLYYGLPNGKCINNNLGNKLCPDGWIRHIDKCGG